MYKSKKDGEVSRLGVALSFWVTFPLRLSRVDFLESCIAVTYTNTWLKGGSSRTGVAKTSLRSTGLHQSMETVKIVAQWPKTGHDIVLPKWYQSRICAPIKSQCEIPIITILTCRIPHQIGFSICLLAALPYAGLAKVGSGSLPPRDPLNIELGGLTRSAWNDFLESSR
jgi:hypothetical protein